MIEEVVEGSSHGLIWGTLHLPGKNEENHKYPQAE
jgi:hypothetical protein